MNANGFLREPSGCNAMGHYNPGAARNDSLLRRNLCGAAPR